MISDILFHEYSLDDHLDARYQDGVEDGIEIGTEKGIKIGTEKGIGIGEQKIIKLLKSGKSPDQIIKEYDAKDA